MKIFLNTSKCILQTSIKLICVKMKEIYIYKIVVRIYLEFKIYIGIFQFEEGGGP